MPSNLVGGTSSYSRVAIWLHWLIAVLLIANLIAGLWILEPMIDSADPATKQLGLGLMEMHKSIGLTILWLAVIRLAWRLGHPVPPYPDHMTPFEIILARLSHWGFYVVMLLLPLSGWAMVSTGRQVSTVLYWGLVEIPSLPLPRAWGGVFHQSHALLGWITLAMIVVHVAAALKHHWFDRDDVLVRMLPLLRDRRR